MNIRNLILIILVCFITFAFCVVAGAGGVGLVYKLVE